MVVERMEVDDQEDVVTVKRLVKNAKSKASNPKASKMNLVEERQKLQTPKPPRPIVVEMKWVK